MRFCETELPSAIRTLEAGGWFSQRTEQTRARLAAIARLRNFRKDELIYSAGDPANGVFGLVSGSLYISFPRVDGEEFTLLRAGSGFWVGDLALFSGATRLVSVRAAEPTQMVQFPPSALTKLVEEDPQLYADFYALTYENFRTAFEVMSTLSMSSTEKRVATRLLFEAETRADNEGWIHVSQPELAGSLAMSLPTLQRTMRRFTSSGLVKNGYGRIQVLDRNALLQICGE